MNMRSNRESFVLLLGDALTFAASLWLTLTLRYQSFPTLALWNVHFSVFVYLFAVWIVVFFIFDLYGRQKTAFRRKLFDILLRAQVINIAIALVAFYFIPTIGIAPKVNLFLYTIVSSVLIMLWRLYVVEWFITNRPESIAVVGEGAAFDELRQEFIQNPKYGFRLVEGVSAQLVVADLYTPMAREEMRRRYEQALRGTTFVDVRSMYASIFDRMPLTLLGEGWFLRNLPRARTSYDALKRLMDFTVALPLGIISLVVYPFVALAIYLEDRGTIFISQERVGKGGKKVQIYKFRSMSVSDSGKEVLKTKGHVTRVGSFLRKSRLDELPQLWSVVRGDLSLVGPRPELPALADIYSKEIPHYDVRHVIKPGLSGWAQIYHEQHPHHGTAVDDTRDKLSYDLFYVKNRSFVLDLKIALKTLKILVSFVGR